MSLEAPKVSAWLKWMRRQGAFAEKMHGNEYMRKGLADIMAVYVSMPVMVEAKRDWHQRMEPAQVQVQKEARAAGAVHICTWRQDDIEKVFQLVRSGWDAALINLIVDRDQESFRKANDGRRKRVLPIPAMGRNSRAAREMPRESKEQLATAE